MRYILKKDLLVRKLKNTMMVYNPENSDMYELNDIAGEFYEKLKKNIDFDGILNEFMEEYDEEQSVIEADLKEIERRFMELGILTVEE